MAKTSNPTTAKTMAPAAMRREQPAALPMQQRLAPLGMVDAETRTVDVVFTTGAAVRRRRFTGWDSSVPYDEILVVSESAVDLTRLNAGGPVLDSHGTWSLDSLRAVVDRAWIDGKEGKATIRFPAAGTHEASDRLFAMVEQQIVRNVSCGYSQDKVRVERAAKEGEVEKWIVERWTPIEISFVTVNADPGAQVRAADDDDRSPVFPVEFTGDCEHVGAVVATRMRMTARAKGLRV